MKKILVIALTLSVSGLVALAAEDEKKEKPAATDPRSKTLEKYDKNANGKLDPDEREAMRKDRQAETKDRQAEALKKYDKNGDGKIDDAEREAALAERRKAAEGKKPAEKPAEKKDK